MISIRLLGYGERVNTLRDVEESVTMYAARATDKLWSQGSTRGAVNVFVKADRFKLDEPRYQNGRTIPLPEPEATFASSPRHTVFKRRVFKSWIADISPDADASSDFRYTQLSEYG